MRNISIGTNMMECGDEWRMSKEHLGPLAECGVTQVEVHMGARHERVEGDEPFRLDKSFVDFHDEKHLHQIRQWLDELGMETVALHTSPMGELDLASCDEDIRHFAAQELALMPRACEVLGAPVMVVHPGGKMRDGTTPGKQCEQLRKSLDAVLPEAQRLHLCIALENLLANSIFGDIAFLVEQVTLIGGPHVGICLDTGHANVMGFDVTEAVRAIGDRLYALHVHDNDGTGDQHRPPFSGTIDWSGFAAALDDVGYPGPLNLEVVDRVGGNPASRPFIRAALDAGRRMLVEPVTPA